MKKKLRLPILLLAVVIMLSIFYIKEASNNNSDPVSGDDLNASSLNPEFTEARLLSLEEANNEIDELEASIAAGNLTAVEVSNTTAKIQELKNIKHQEASLEATLIEMNSYDDVLVLLGEEALVIDIYTEDEITVSKFVELARLAKGSFGSDTVVKVITTSMNE
ncbi:MAG: SpoIIIAH-like family protein [Erysipelotrichaceae bacterium]|nr:SpoIIIAH-like family protein [Erysipelotrichaceae bacterium]